MVTVRFGNTTVWCAIFTALDRHARDFARRENADVVQKIWHGNRKCAYVLAVGEARAREFIQLDFFVEFSMSYCPNLITHCDLVTDRQPLRNFYTPRSEVELLFTVMRRLFKDDWADRHCGRVAELRARITGDAWLPTRYSWLRETVDLACAGDVKTLARQRGASWRRLKRVAWQGLSPVAALGHLVWQSRRGATRLRDETGNLSLVLGTVGRGEDDSLDALNIVFHRYLTVDEAWLEKHGTGRSPASALKLAAHIKLLKQRKGLVFVHLGADTPRARRLASLLDRLGMVDQVLAADGTAGASRYAAPVVEVRDSRDVIAAIVATQTAKTEAAMARSGTQTSGRADG